MTVRIGVVGYGYWGPNLVRNFADVNGATVAWCADSQPDRRALVQRRHPTVRVTDDASQVIDDDTVDAVVIATPVSTHFGLAEAALATGKHVLISKPMAQTSAQCLRLMELADRNDLVLMVDHTYLYAGAIRRMHELLSTGELGDLHYFDSVRVNLGLFQRDIDVLWDLAPHDLSILSHLIPVGPAEVSATGADHTGAGHVDIAYVTLHYPDGFLAHCHLNWLSPVKVRRILLGGSRRMLVYDDLDPGEKVRVYDRGVRVTTTEGIHESLVSYRTGDMWAPKLDNREALSIEVAHFIECVRFKKMPLSGGATGLQVVRLLEAAALSLAEDGRRVAVPQP